jgi:hypothetical protein
MAKKNKKDADQHIDNKEEFNDIDENFGLPDLELEPLDDLSEETAVEETAVEEAAVEETVEEEVVEEPVEEEVIEEAAADDYSNAYTTDTETSEEEEEYQSAAQVADEDGDQEEETGSGGESTYVPGTYAAKAREQESNSGKIIGIIVLVLLIGGAIGFYYGYYQPAQVEAAKKAKQEQIAAAEAAKKKQQLADEAAAEEERQREQARLQAEEDAQPKIGTIEAISERTSRYYVVVSSGLDGDLAMDYAKKEVNNGTNIKLLSPLGTNKFYRVTVADYDTWAEAENSANDLKANFGDGVWVLKY